MATEEKRSSARALSKGTLTGAPYLARVITHLDEEFQGALEVTLLRDSGNQTGDETQTYTVRYASPFYGSTAYEFTGKNLTYDDSQQSYGFWGVPPDVGVTGIVCFIDGKPDKGYWLCCVQDIFQNHMIPAIGGTKNYKTDEDYDQGEHPLPVVEHNRKANELDKNLEIDKIPRAVHPIAKRIKDQGLIRDEFRGTSSTTSRRDVPNMVFGMSSPGPLNRGSKKKFLGNRQSLTNDPQPVNRWGGTQFVMDDGDDRYFREGKPWEKGPTYVKNPGGDKEIPYHEHFRIRTRTGHQIVLHNSEDLIYIGNSRGTAWIELTSDGKIDIFANDSISVRTKQDFNFRCDRDFNLHIGRNFNTKVEGEMHTHVGKDSVLIVDRDQKIQVKRRKDETVDEEYRQTVNGHVKKVYSDDYTHNVLGRMDWRVTKGVSFSGGIGSAPDYAPFDAKRDDPADPCANDGDVTTPVTDVNGPTPDRIDIKIYKDMRIEHIGVNVDHTIDGYLKTKIKGTVDINTNSTWKQTSAGNIDIKSGGHIFNTSAGTNETNAGGNIIETAPNIHMNGPTAGTAPTAEIAVLPEEARTSAKGTLFCPLKTIDMPELAKQGDVPTTLTTIMRRMPTFEGYPHHENLEPSEFKPGVTDRDVLGQKGEGIKRYKAPDEKPPPATYRKYQKPGDNPF